MFRGPSFIVSTMQEETTPIFKRLWYDWTQQQPGIEPTNPLGQCWVPPIVTFYDQQGLLRTYSLPGGSIRSPHPGSPVERWNSVLKNAGQSAVVKKESIKENIIQLLVCYRATPHATPGEKSCKLLHGRDMHTKLHVARFQKIQKEDLGQVWDKVKHKHNMHKQTADKSRNVKQPVLKPGNFVKLISQRPKENVIPSICLLSKLFNL